MDKINTGILYEEKLCTIFRVFVNIASWQNILIKFEEYLVAMVGIVQ